MSDSDELDVDVDEAFMAKRAAMRAEADRIIDDPAIETPGSPD